MHFHVDGMLETAAGKDADRLGAQRPADAVDRIAADIEQAAAGHLGLQADVRRVHRQRKGEAGGDALDRADDAVVEQLPDCGGSADGAAT